MQIPFEHRRNLRQQNLEQGATIGAGTLGYIPPYKDNPATSWKDQFVSRLSDTNKSPHDDFFDENERQNVLNKIGSLDGRPEFPRLSDNTLSLPFLVKYLQSNVVPGDDKITQVTAREFVEQDPRQGLANRYPGDGIVTT